MRKITKQVEDNRRILLAALRSGDYEKGSYVAGQDEPPPGATGFCAVGLPYTLFLNNTGPVQALRKVLGVTREDLSRIQNEWNDSPLTFPEIADRIESEIFGSSILNVDKCDILMSCNSASASASLPSFRCSGT